MTQRRFFLVHLGEGGFGARPTQQTWAPGSPGVGAAGTRGKVCRGGEKADRCEIMEKKNQSVFQGKGLQPLQYLILFFVNWSIVAL